MEVNSTRALTINRSQRTTTSKLTYKEAQESQYEYVDLGLSVKWATCNVGASKPEEYGDYFAWGETEPYYNGDSQNPTSWKSGKSRGYWWSSYKYCFDSDNTMTKYCDNSSYGYNGFTDSKTVLDSEDDAAHVNWGGDWRMPTKAEFDELLNSSNCTWTWTTVNGVNGYKVVSKKSGCIGNFIFLPAAGQRYYMDLNYIGESGTYWSSSLYTNGPSNAHSIFFDSRLINGYGGRVGGLSIRPVCQEKENDIINPKEYLVYHNNYCESFNGWDYYKYSSYVVAPSGESWEIKLQLPSISQNKSYNFCSSNLAKDNECYLKFKSDGIDCSTLFESFNIKYSDISPAISGTSVLTIYLSKELTSVNGIDVSKAFSGFSNLSSMFADYYRENDEGIMCEYKGIPEGTKIYYVKVWDSDGTLVYLGHPKYSSINEQWGWHSITPQGEKYEFAGDHIPTSMDITITPFGHGVDD